MLQKSKTKTVFKKIAKISLITLLLLIISVYGISAVVIWNLSHPSRENVKFNIKNKFSDVEDIGFYSRKDSVFLKGWLIKAEGNKKTVIFGHGYGRNRLQTDVPLIEIVEDLNKKGVNVVMFDMRNSGDSQTALTTVGYNEAYDLLGAYDYVIGRSDISNDVILEGFSMGAVATILAVEKEPAIKKAIADAPFADLRMYMSEKLTIWSKLPSFPFNYTCIQLTPFISDINISEVSPMNKVKNLKDTKILLIHGLNDNDIDVKNSHLIADKYNNAKIIEFPNADHVKSFASNKELYLKTIEEFIFQE